MAKTENIRKTTLEGFGERYRRISPQRCEYQSATEEEFVSILDERDEHPFDLNPRVPMLEVSEKGERKPLTWAYALEISANLVAVIEGRLLRTEVSLFRKESTNRASIVLEQRAPSPHDSTT